MRPPFRYFLVTVPLLSGTVAANGFPQTSVGNSVQKKEERRDQTIWADEVLAQQYGATITALWDRLIAKEDAFRILGGIPFQSMSLGQAGKSEELPWGGTRTTWRAGGKRYTTAAFAKLLQELSEEGYSLLTTEWHHESFKRGSHGAESEYHVVLGGLQEKTNTKFVIDAHLAIEWSEDKDEQGHFKPAAIRVQHATIDERVGAPPFRQVFSVNAEGAGQADPKTGLYNDPQPIIVADLDRNGFPDIIAAGWNMVFQNEGQGKFKRRTMLERPQVPAGAALVADLTADTFLDLVLAPIDGYLLLFEGRPDGTFIPEPVTIRATKSKLRGPQVLSAGDMDGDGRLDLWVGQYREPYTAGHMPAPYYDANDGYPWYLLRNEGRGRFSDQTELTGLKAKRKRRVYSGSLVDVDQDGDMDLLAVSDFAGVDLFAGSGRGRFKDVTKNVLGNPRLFGMGHAFGDFDRDGQLDFYALGMASTTARRLEKMGLGRKDKPEHNSMRQDMGYGNRMYLGRSGGQFEVAPFEADVARTGWSWGVTAADFDLDGFVDLYVANGHKSGESTADYCSEFWRHDIYVEQPDFGGAQAAAFRERLRGHAKGKTSWNGYEHNRLLMNREGKGFDSLGQLLGVGFEFDARVVVGDDLNADGKTDLIVTSSGTAKTTGLHLVSNVWPTEHHFIGVRLADNGPGFSPLGAEVRLKTKHGQTVQHIVSGDSHASQHSTSKVFGLGTETEVLALEVRWPGGHVQAVRNPKVDQYHELAPAKQLVEAAREGVESGVAAEARSAGVGDGEPTRGPAAGEPGRRRTAGDAREHEEAAHGGDSSKDRGASGRVLALIVGLLLVVGVIAYAAQDSKKGRRGKRP